MESLAERIKWVIKTERVFPSYRQWAKATQSLPGHKPVKQSSLDDLVQGNTTNPRRATVEALAAAAGVRPAWLMYNDGAPYGTETEEQSDQYPSRVHVVQSLIAMPAPAEVIRRLRAIRRYKTDPGALAWMRKASELWDDFEREQHDAGATSDNGS